MTLINGDCLEEMKKLETNTIDLLFCDLPYGQTSCKWDCLIDLDLFWKEVNRICKDTTPMFFTCSTKFGVSLINSNPKNFRYDLVWVKSAPCGFLNAKKMPMKKHEMVYVFYKKLPLYDLSSHTHKFLKEDITLKEHKTLYGNLKIQSVTKREPRYNPPLPDSVIRETTDDEVYKGNITYNHKDRKDPIYEPPLPNSILEIKSEKGKHATQKPLGLTEWILKYYSKSGDKVLDPTMGSGTMGVSCKKMGREFIGIELDEKIFKVAENRINN